MLGRIVAIGGCTNAGKTTLRDRLKDELSKELSCRVTVLSQDDFFKKKEDVRQLSNKDDPSVVFYNYDEAYALDEQALCEELKRLRQCNDLILIDGNMLTELPSVLSLFHTATFITLNYETCRERRTKRTDYDPPDEVGYFDQVVWKAYEEHLVVARNLNDPRIGFLDANDPQIYANLKEIATKALSDAICIQREEIRVDDLCTFVTSPKCGAISVFIGTTRDFFEGKRVKLLSYEHYEEMALSELRKLCHEARNKFPSVERIAITHRIGEVPVTEKSVVIATSSPHRKDAIQATEFLIDRLKTTVPIWKKEIYENDESAWKENSECRKPNS